MDVNKDRKRKSLVATHERNKKRKRPLLHFYINGELHTKLYINRGADLLYAQNHVKNKIDTYMWRDAQRKLEHGISTKEAAQLVNRSVWLLYKYVDWGHIPEPQRLGPYYRKGKWQRSTKRVWSRQNVFDLHEFLSMQHEGRPRKDGIIVPKALPTRLELSAMMEHDMVYYVQNSKGEFVPAWKEAEW